MSLSLGCDEGDSLSSSLIGKRSSTSDPKGGVPRWLPCSSTPHVCSPPSTADLIGREMDFECRCGRRWRLEHYFGEDGSLLGPSWVLL
jgi:hypothetical protein